MKIGFFGCGNMGRALAMGFSKTYPDLKLYLYTPSLLKAEEVANTVGGVVVKNLEDMPKDLDWYVLAFKPQALFDFSFTFNSDAKILSVLAGTSISTLEKKFQIKNIARLMPNTPSSIGEGANLFFSPFLAAKMEEMLRSLGKLFIMKTEEELDNITAFSGSGPALIFEFARIFEKHLNLKASGNSFAREIITQTFLGSAKLMEQATLDGVSFETLREQVTSKKGVTYEALQILEKNRLENIMGDAFEAAHQRTLELKKGI